MLIVQNWCFINADTYELYYDAAYGSNCSVLCWQVNTLDEHEWHRLEQAHVLANVQQAFNDGGAAGADLTAEDVDDAMFASGDMLSPSLAPAGSTDAHTMALILQQQLDAINNEIRWKVTDMK
jgi:hypothetical protein